MQMNDWKAEPARPTDEARYRQLADALPQIVWITRGDGNGIEYINAQWLAYTGMSYDDSLRDANQAIHPDDRDAALRAWQEALVAGQPYVVQMRLRRADGVYRWFLVRTIPAFDDMGRVTAWFGTSTDVHEQREAAQDAHFLVDLAEIIRRAPSADALLDAVVQSLAAYLRVNRCYFAEIDEAHDRFSIRREYRVALPSIVGDYWLADYPVAVREALRSGQALVVNDAATDSTSAAAYAHAYAPYGLRARIVVPFLREGAWISNLVVATDMPRQWQGREVALLETTAERVWLAVEKLRLDHENETRLQDARFLADLSERIRIASDADHLLAVSAEALGRYLRVQRCFFAEIFEREDRWVVHHDYHEGIGAIAGEYPLTAYNLGARQEMAAGRVLVVADAQTDPRSAAIYETAYQPLAVNGHVVVPLLRDGAWVSTLIVTVDQPRNWQAREIALLEAVAERTWNTFEKLRATAALQASEARLQELFAQEQAARAAAEEANQLKDEFLATVSHELRTPLTALLGYLHLLQSRPRDPAYVARTLDKLVRSARAQSQLIDDLLDVSQIVSGKLRIERLPIDFSMVIHSALDTLRPTIEAKGLALGIDLHPAASQISGDANRLQQVVWNLLSNAAKFTPSGGVIRVALVPHGAYAELTVRDTGQGIAPDFLPFVFDRFRQADSTSTRPYGGLGLGLAIVRHLVELHGGTVTASSAGEGQGATFTILLPLDPRGAAPGLIDEAASEHAGAAPLPPELRGLRVLVVDDQPEILELLDEVLTPCAATVIGRSSARAALAALQEQRPDLLISDIAMPEEDGYWLIRQVRDLPPAFGGQTPAIALTAYTRGEERARVLAAGFQQYLPKPVDPSELLAIVASFVPQATSQSGTEQKD
jgi:PAS domain S-box-containing protein